MQRPNHHKSPIATWLPFSLKHIDLYYIGHYTRTFVIILIALIALVSIGDMFQRFDDFVVLSRTENLSLQQIVATFLKYYGTWVPQLVFQYMLPAAMLISGAITVTASYAGPRGNNEYIVIRSAGVPVSRALLPLLLPAFIIAILFQATRDHYLPTMVRESHAISNRLRSRTSNPTSITYFGDTEVQTIAIGWFAPGNIAHNVIVETRPAAGFHRGDPNKGDNTFTAHRAAAAKLEGDNDQGYLWIPLENAETHTYSRYARRKTPWTKPVHTDVTPAMIERQALGDSVSSWHDLMLIQRDDSSARFEMHWRIAEPVACLILMVWGVGVVMGRMLRGNSASYITSISIAMIAAALFYSLRLAGKTLWESGMLTPVQSVWAPLAAAALVALVIFAWMER